MDCLDQEIHKYMTFEQFVGLIETGQSYVTSILQWPDRHEGFNLDAHVRGNSDVYPEDLRDSIISYKKNSIYAQSWTHSKESDGLWRAYSPNQTGVRVSTRVGLVKSCIEAGLAYFAQKDGRGGDLPEVNCYPVEYVDDFHPEPIPSHGKFSPGDVLICRRKRKAFEYEQEYRFSFELPPPASMPRSFTDPLDVHRQVFQAGKALPVIYYPLPARYLSAITLDPRAPDHFEHVFLAYCKRNGLQRIGVTIEKSTLYDPPK